eukprot:Rhum_TRINITY_DN4753_c0_g1::Rhum_TRINITY_DN4753_c0_g1_i1::g.15444::m.15444
MRGGISLRKDLERFADRFCDMFTAEAKDGGLGTASAAHKTRRLDSAQAVVEKILLDHMLEPSHAERELSLSERLGRDPSRRAFLQVLRDEEAASRRSARGPHTGLAIKAVALQQGTNVGLALDGNSHTSHVRRFRTRRQPSPPPAAAAPLHEAGLNLNALSSTLMQKQRVVC